MIPSAHTRSGPVGPAGHNVRRLATALLWPLAALLPLALLPLAGHASESAVGQVTLLIGEAHVVRKGGDAETLRRGTEIRVGDRIETAANGHVHVRFVDNAAVSVRPQSVLEVVTYQYDSDRPQASEVRLQLDQGAGRSISGRATSVDKNRFRLNTPLAAIGVRGTDFIVQSSDAAVRATVAEGSIVVGALGAGCSAAALGPCAGGQNTVLSAEMGRMMVEMQRGDQVARVVPATGTLLAAVAPPVAEERVAAQRAAESAARTAGLQAAEPYRRNDRTAADALTIAAATLPNLNSRSNPNAQLAWGRYSVAPAFNDGVSVPYALARVGRDPAVGNSDFTLFRSVDANQPRTELANNEASATFRLNRAQATFDTGSRVEAATVDGGTLTLDFARRSFATALALSSPTAGRAELRAAGDVGANGVFSVGDRSAPRQNLEVVSGAFTLDGKEAGYLFERGTAGGLFRGKTLWGR
ncbi:MAG: FecR domain-containing protein [Rubrivivax sp.]|nr:FecR domain-containing protein [Rubrivivax sp.]